MTKKPFALVESDTFAHGGMRYTVIGPVQNTGERTTVYTDSMVLHIPNRVDLKMV